MQKYNFNHLSKNDKNICTLSALVSEYVYYCLNPNKIKGNLEKHDLHVEKIISENKSGYTGVVIRHDLSKSIFITSRGTPGIISKTFLADFDLGLDLIKDKAELLFKLLNNSIDDSVASYVLDNVRSFFKDIAHLQLSCLDNLCKEVLNNNLFKGYKIILCGHSYGGYLSAYKSIEYNFDAVTFDSPGFDNKVFQSLKKLKPTCKLYNFIIEPNFINSCGSHLSQTYQLKLNANIKKKLTQIRGALNSSLVFVMGNPVIFSNGIMHIKQQIDLVYELHSINNIRSCIESA